MNITKPFVASLLLLCMAQEAFADKTYILATGRRDPRIYVIDLSMALRLTNDKTPNAIVSRAKVALDRLDGRPLGDPGNIVVSEDRRTAYVVNHHGAIDNAEFLQHGGRGNIAVMNVAKMTKPKSDDTTDALEQSFDSGYFGALGLVLLKDTFVIGHAESHLTEDGGNRVTFVDRKTGSRKIDIDEGNGVAFECHLLAFAIRRNHPAPVGTRRDPEGASLYRDANDLRRLVARKGSLQVDYRDIVSATVRRK